MSRPLTLVVPAEETGSTPPELEVPAPPPVPPAPSGVRMYRLIGVPITLGVLLGAAVSQGGGTGLLVLGTIVLVAVSVGGASVLPRWEHALHRGRLARRERDYRDLLDRRRATLAAVVIAQQSSLAARDPDPHAWLRLATDRPDGLWQRSGAEPDGVPLRVGTTDEPSSIAVRAPRQVDPEHPDPLIDLAQALAARVARLPDWPQTMPLHQLTGVSGPRPAVLATTRALIVQLAAQYSPEQLTLGIYFSTAELDAWRWARWLPHVADADRSARWLVSATDTARVDSPGQLFVAIVADPALAGCVPPGARCVVLADRAVDLPVACSVVLEVDAAGGGMLRVAGHAAHWIDELDAAPIEVAEQFARALAGRRPRGGADGSDAIYQVQLDGSYRPLT